MKKRNTHIKPNQMEDVEIENVKGLKNKLEEIEKRLEQLEKEKDNE